MQHVSSWILFHFFWTIFMLNNIPTYKPTETHRHNFDLTNLPDYSDLFCEPALKDLTDVSLFQHVFCKL